MKRFIASVSLFSLIVLLAGGAFEWSIRRIPNLYAFKDSVMTARGAEFSTLIIGSSVAHAGIDASIFPKPQETFNLAITGELVPYDYMVFQKYAPNLRRLRNLIWGIAFQTLWMDDRLTDDNTNQNGHRIYMDIDQTDHFTDHLEVLVLKSLAFRKFSQHYLAGMDTKNCDAWGLNTGLPQEKVKASWVEKCEEKAADHKKLMLANPGVFEENEQRIREVAAFCNEHNVQLFLVVPPVAARYDRACDPTLKQKMRHTLSAIAADYPNVVFLDYFADTRFTDADFFDCNHLTCDHGAQKFTRLLLQDMKNHGFKE